MNKFISRRQFCKISAITALALPMGCNSSTMKFEEVDMMTTGSISSAVKRPAISIDPNISGSAKMYRAMQDGDFFLPPVPYKKMDPRFRRQRVVNRTGLSVGSVLIDTRQHFAFLVVSEDEAVRYGVGIGKAGFAWSGSAVIGRKAQWPRWTPPAEMIERKPKLAIFRGGMPGGVDNPLGARALYLYKDGLDTLYRLHGTPEWWSIGKSMSSGCIRFLNQDIIDLHNRISRGSTVVVI